ncbi:MAG: ABC transporter permease [Vicinamibacterales bacterium]
MPQDVRFAVRTLLSRPAFTLIAVSTLALGIGANAAIFSVVRAVLLRPLAFSEPERLVKVVGLDRAEGTPGNLSPADFFDFEQQTTAFARVGAHGWVGFFTLGGSQLEAERIGGVNVTDGFFPSLSVQPLMGRLFTADDDRPDASTVVVLSHGFWQRRYGGRRDVIGEMILLNARPATIIGVLPPEFRHIEPNPEREAEVFVPYGFDRASPNRGGHFIRAVGRLQPDATIADARAQLETIATQLEQQYPESNTDQGVLVSPLHEAMVRESRPALVLLLWAVGAVLLVACANLANLLLASGSARQRELAIRGALGAGRTRLIRQLLTESLVLSLAGGAVGVVLAFWAARALSVLSEAGMPNADLVAIDLPVLGFALAIAALTGLAFGIVPALQLSGRRVHDTLKEGARGQTAGRSGRRIRDVLVGAEMALSIVLLVAAGLLLRSFAELQQVDVGFARDEVLTMQVAVPTALYEEGEQIPFYEQLIERVRSVPGVRSAGAVNILPLSGNYDSRGIQIEDRPAPIGQAPSVQSRSVTPDYFEAMGIPLLRGRGFDSRDTASAPLVVLVSDAMALRYWPGEDPIGKRITFNSGILPDQQQNVGGPGSREVIGVVGDVKHLGLDEEVTPFFYTPHAQQPSYHTMTLIVRAAVAPATLASAVRHELTQMDRNVPVSQVRTLNAVVARVTTAPRLRAWLVGVFAALALLLALVGVYGVVSYLVSQRTREIGVRLALGARVTEVLGMLVKQGMIPVIAGLGFGLIGALMASRLLAGMLFGVTAGDTVTYFGAASVLATTALAATVVAARRATQVDPVVALRSE